MIELKLIGDIFLAMIFCYPVVHPQITIFFVGLICVHAYVYTYIISKHYNFVKLQHYDTVYQEFIMRNFL